MERVLQVGLSENLGGIEAYLYNQFKSLDHTKLIYDFLCFRGCQHIPYEKEIMEQGGLIHHINVRHRYIVTYYKQYIKLLRKYHYRAVVLNNLSFGNMSLLLLARFFGVPIRVIHSHNAGTDVPAKTLKAKLLSKFNKWIMKPSVTDYWACSKLAGDWLFGKDINYKVIPNAIVVDRYRFSKQKSKSIREKMGLEGKFVVGHVARMAKQKNQGFLIDIFYEICKRRQNAVLLFIGAPDKEGVYYQEVKKKINKYGLQNQVKLLGMRYDVPDLMQAMDCFLLPSLYEGLPVVGVEAQAAGLPCYFSDTITKEVKITRLANYISLDKPASAWAEDILIYINNNREVMADAVADAGFDVKVVARKLQNYYLNGNRTITSPAGGV